ncbi:MAG: sulfatase-like hydrolase/transferase [Pirellulaceae bacterium]
MTRCFTHLLLTVLLGLPAVSSAAKPNIVVILSDDQGYADVSYNPHAPREVQTPHIDALARSAIICTQGYTSGHVCSTTRAGFMTGRYQQRFGIYTAGEGGSGVPFTETFFPQHLEPAGYHSGAFGKWHLGFRIQYNAMHRGFDEFYGFMGRGAHDYFNLALGDHPIYRGLQPIEDKGYLTNRITSEAVSFIKQHKQEPFFLYVAYNAVHAPAQAPAGDIQNLTGDKTRDTLMAMIKHLDNGVGQIVATLKQEKVFDNTLLFYLTDNGGSKVMMANNAPLRGFKQQDYEGGIRVPFIVSWPAQLKGGIQCHVPMMSIDILPTALAAAGLSPPTKQPLDGENMLPALQGKVKQLHDNLYWSSGGREAKWAIRSGPWKLVGIKGTSELFNLETDVSESKDLSAELPGKVKELTQRHDAWLAQMADPASGSGKKWDPDKPAPAKKKNKNKNTITSSTDNP